MVISSKIADIRSLSVSLRVFLKTLLMAGSLPLPGVAAAHCSDLVPLEAGPATDKRAVTASDLIRLRDIALPDASISTGNSPLAVSPDGTRVAFVLTRADPETNSYCRGLVSIPIKPGSTAHVLDYGDELETLTLPVRGLLSATGIPAVVTPRWSPNGQWIAYRKKTDGVTQVWRVSADGQKANQVTHGKADVESLAWTADGKQLVFASETGLLKAKRSLNQEARSGFFYDDRFVPAYGFSPRIRGPLAERYAIVDAVSGSVRAATAGERKLLVREVVAGVSSAQVTVGKNSRKAWTEKVGASPFSPRTIQAENRDGKAVSCSTPSCTGKIAGPWWTGKGTLVFARREGWANEKTGLYRWSPGSGEPRRILLTDDVVRECVAAPAALLCIRENATTPQKLVRIDAETGRSRIVFDSNPQFSSIALGQVQRLRWTNDVGLKAWGDLVLPGNYRPGTKLPMIVVQYDSKGFLRGGTGNEYPIYLFAARGYAVLSFQRPPSFATTVPAITDYDEVAKINAKDWAERRSVLSSLESGIAKALATGAIDRDRIGITGLSDGASTARFAMINSDLFAAAAISTCCMDMNTVMTYGGLAWADHLQAEGYPPAIRDDRDFWRPYSLAVDPARITTPLLMQLADDEFLLGLETFSALHEAHRPVAMYVFPDEHHNKVQPVHRLAIYRRNIDWFDFWLKGYADTDPAKAEQYRRWAALRDHSAG